MTHPHITLDETTYASLIGTFRGPKITPAQRHLKILLIRLASGVLLVVGLGQRAKPLAPSLN
jgi:hypothetical protein